MRKRCCSILVALLFCVNAGAQHPKPVLSLAASSNIAPALDAIAEDFQKTNNADVRITYGAPGELAAQVHKGAPFDVFLSADADYPKQLVGARLADSKTLTQYAQGRLVLYVMSPLPVDVPHEGFNALTDARIKSIAIADPKASPYGAAAIAALKKHGKYDAVHSKLIFEPNDRKAAEIVGEEKADAGIFGLSNMAMRSLRQRGRVWEVPMEWYPALEHTAVVLKHGKGNPLAAKFIQELAAGKWQGQFARVSFLPPRVARPANPKTQAAAPSRGSEINAQGKSTNKNSGVPKPR